MDSGWWFAACIAATVIAILLGVRNLSHHYSVVGCEAFERETGRPTTFVDYHYWDWACLTYGSDGKLIPISALRDFTETP